YNGPNLVLKYDRAQKRLVNIAVDERSSPYYALRDRQGYAIGVTACDIDGDGREEIYFLNTNNAFSGVATYSDKLFKFRNNRWEDILSDEVNVARGVASLFAGRSVACVDRTGSGRYSIYIANYAYGNVGPDALIEMDPEASDLSQGILALRDVAAEAGVNRYTGGRGVSVGPILSSSASDIFCDNENGPNFLFHNRGDGTFVDAAASTGVDDPHQHGRGVALADFNRDGKVDIVYGNWNGPHRLYLQMSAHGKVRFRDIASPKFSMPSPVRTVIAADFDNDQELEIFFNNFAHRSSSANRLFRVIRREHGDPLIEELNPGDALEPEGRGTGGVVTDFDGDGMLDLILSHGESMAQPLSVFRGNQGFSNNWLRVVPRTRFGAFARGAKVVLYTRKSGAHLRVIDGGSGYLCEMEPVAHFGLGESRSGRPWDSSALLCCSHFPFRPTGKDEASSVEVTWPDGKMASRSVASEEMNSVLEIPYPQGEDRLQDPAPLECGQGFSQQESGHCTDTNECIQFPFVCPRDKPVCVNTYGSYRCRTNKRCSRGYEPNEDGTACVAQVAFLVDSAMCSLNERRVAIFEKGSLGDADICENLVVCEAFLGMFSEKTEKESRPYTPSNPPTPSEESKSS
ncbi:Cartilage acidic protein 1, partial [Galemys pyrenaicus]